MKVAYLMQVHKNPLLLERAVNTLSSDNSVCFVHVDRKANIGEFAAVRPRAVFIDDRVSVYWGEFSQVDATIHLLKHALSNSVEFEYFVFLQGSDYPLRSGRYIEQFLDRHQGCEFINLCKMPAPGYPLSKINTVRFPSDKPVRRFLSRTLRKVGLATRDYRKYLGEFDAYAGDAYWTLSRPACAYLIDCAARNPQLERYFRNSFTADEMFFHTILGSSPFLTRVRKTLMFLYRDWSAGDDTRHQISAEHVSYFEQQNNVWVDNEWGSGEVLFARKLSDDRIDLVDRIDAMIQRKETEPVGGLDRSDTLLQSGESR